MVPEVNFAPKGDVATELMPPSDTNLDRFLESLRKRGKAGRMKVSSINPDPVEQGQRFELLLDNVQCGLLALHFFSDFLH